MDHGGNRMEYERIAGGLYGLLIGDALGVPYEFYEEIGRAHV